MKFRKDIEGLRAVAVVLVILNHLQLGGYFSGGFVGVDIFFVISGFLITTLLMREYSENAIINNGFGWISLRSFYFRRARRILPSAILVLLLTVVFSFSFINSVQANQNLRDAFFALLFLTNLKLIQQKTDYFQQGLGVSPIQHFWSLSVEEQFYFIFPALFLGSVLMHGVNIRGYSIWWWRRLSLTIGILTLSSFVWSVFQTSSAPISSYFSSLTRAWEIGLGSLLAITTFKSTPIEQKYLNFSLALIGVFGIALSLILFDDTTLFPGINALLPTLSTCCLIYVGKFNTANVIIRIFSSKIFTFIGRISYSLYLWHLPFLILLPGYLESHLSSSSSRALLLIPIFFASLLTYTFIERPMRNLKPPVSWNRKPAPIKIGDLLNQNKVFWPLFVIVFLVVGSLYLKPTITEDQTNAFAPKNYTQGTTPKQEAKSSPSLQPSNKDVVPGSTATPENAVAPNPRQLTNELTGYEQALSLWREQLKSGLKTTKVPQKINPALSELKGTAKGQWGECLKSMIPSCTSGSDNAMKTAVFVGDSYGSAIFPMVKDSLNQTDWRVEGIFRGQCMVADVIPLINGKPSVDCLDFRKKWLIYLKSLQPNLVIITDFFDQPISLPEGAGSDLNYWKLRLNDSLKVISDSSKRVVYFISKPGPSSLINCVAANGQIGKDCFSDINMNRTKVKIIKDLAKTYGIDVIDSRDWFCVPQGCPAIVGNVAVYSDFGHVSGQYAAELAPLFQVWLSSQGI